jgi:hypothetical protein
MGSARTKFQPVVGPCEVPLHQLQADAALAGELREPLIRENVLYVTTLRTSYCIVYSPWAIAYRFTVTGMIAGLGHPGKPQGRHLRWEVQNSGGHVVLTQPTTICNCMQCRHHRKITQRSRLSLAYRREKLIVVGHCAQHLCKCAPCKRTKEVVGIAPRGCFETAQR